MEYVIRLDQGDYYQERGGNDWGRSSRSGATVFDSEEEAVEVAERLKSFGARVEEAY